MPADPRYHRAMRFLVWTLLATCAFFVGAEELRYEGRPVVQVLQEMRSHGIGLIYNSQLAPDTLRVLREPHSTDPVDLLIEILKPHKLGLSRISDNTYAIVALKPPAPEQPVQVAASDEELIVTSSRYSLVAPGDEGSHTFLTQRQLESLPRLGDESLRAVQRLPGVASNGFSALDRIRGGEGNETQIVLNGLALYEPFHLKDFLGPVSVIDSRLIQSMDAYTGGFTADRGDRMSAVIDIHTLDDVDYRELGLSVFHLSALAGGTMGDANWLASVRRSTLDELVSFSEREIGEPSYLDGFAQLRLPLGPATQLTFNVLGSHDTITALTSSGREQAQADYDNTYFWAQLQHAWSSRLHSSLIASLTTVDDDRTGRLEDTDQQSGRVVDSRSYDIVGVRLDAVYEAERLRHRWGAEARLLDSTYRYASALQTQDGFPFPGDPARNVTRNVNLSPEGREYSVYWSIRWQPLHKLTAEAGLRWDRQTYSRDVAGVDDQFSPRLNVLYELNEATRLRGSWGRFSQPQGIHELQVEDGVQSFFPAQRADHLILSVERDLSDVLQLRVEAYRKDYSRLRPRYENAFDPLVLLPELQSDRVLVAPDDAYVRAVEFLLETRNLEPWNGWISYTRSKAVDRIDGMEVRRSWDQPNAVQAGVSRSGAYWDWTVAGTWRSGWPKTEVAVVGMPQTVQIGPRNGARFGGFSSLDVQVSRRFPFAHSELLVFAQVTNVLQSRNACCVRYSAETLDNGAIDLDARTRYWLPLIPSLGVLWKF